MLHLIKYLGDMKWFKSKKVYLSFGENCLPDNILNRYKLKSFTTPFSHGRSNIEYILQLEQDNYKNFLESKYLVYEEFQGKEVLRLKTYTQLENCYDWRQINGFEFTHHDLIKDPELKLTFMKRVKRLRTYSDKKNYILLYHHRYCAKTNIELLLKHLNDLKDIYSRVNEAQIILFKQVPISINEQRKLDYKELNGIHVFDFHTLQIWDGDDPNLLWAKNDEDLISKMVSIIKKL